MCIPFPLSSRSVWKAAIKRLSLFLSADLYGQQQLSGNTSSKYLNFPIGSRSRWKPVTIYRKYYLENELVNILPRDLKAGKNELRVLLDMTIADIFFNQE